MPRDAPAWSAPGAALRGVAAAVLSAPWIRGRRFRRLLEGVPEGDGPAPSPEGDVDARAATLTLRALGRLPFSPWRNTCLYRSVARCLLLRWRGVDARVRLGVQRADGPAGPLGAHAWVEAPGVPSAPGWDPGCREHAVLEPGRRLRAVIPGPGGLELEVDAALREPVDRWLPLHAEWGGRSAESAPVVRLVRRARDASTANGPPDFSLGGVEGRVDADGRTVRLRGGGAAGTVDLEGGRATLRASADAAAGLHYGLTVSAALLLGRRGRALVHAGAVVAPGGGAWLVAGDARSGKSTTCATLVAAGWDWLSDDQVVLFPAPDGADGVRVAGWPRAFHLDRGWADRRPTGEREEVAPADLGPGRRRSEAPLAGVLLPSVEPDAPTAAPPASAADAFAALVRQCPWLLVDRAASDDLMALLTSAAAPPGPRRRLRLGGDVFGRPDALLSALRDAGLSP